MTVIGWVNTQIAASLGLQSPTLNQAVWLVWRIGVPLGLAGLVLWGYHIAMTRKQTSSKTEAALTMPVASTPISPPPRPQSVGIKAVGGTVSRNLVLGFDVGIDATGANLDRNAAFGPGQNAVGFPPASIDLSHWPTSKLKQEAGDLAKILFDIARNDPQGIDTNFTGTYFPKVQLLASEISRRLGHVKLEELSQAWLGGHMVSNQTLTGPLPVSCVANFINEIADRLSEEKPT